MIRGLCSILDYSGALGILGCFYLSIIKVNPQLSPFKGNYREISGTLRDTRQELKSQVEPRFSSIRVYNVKYVYMTIV